MEEYRPVINGVMTALKTKYRLAKYVESRRNGFSGGKTFMS